VPDRLDDLVGDAETLQRAADEGAAGDLVLQAGVVPGPALGLDSGAVGVDDGGQFLGSIGGQAALHQKLYPADVGNRILGLDAIPQTFPGWTEFSGRIRGIFGVSYDGKPGRFLRKIFHHFWPPMIT
jgi:hypothetical protein